jgi:hypothetical protein
MTSQDHWKLVNVSKETTDERKIARSLEKEENRLAKERKVEVDERMAATDERKVAMKKTPIDE